MLVSETEIDDRFPQGKFVIDGSSDPCRLHCNCLPGGLILFLREDIWSNVLTIEKNKKQKQNNIKFLCLIHIITNGF